jgi:hypothetical protein
MHSFPPVMILPICDSLGNESINLIWPWRCASHWGLLVLSFTFSVVFCGWYFYSHFTHEKTKVQKNCDLWMACKQLHQNCNQGQLHHTQSERLMAQHRLLQCLHLFLKWTTHCVALKSNFVFSNIGSQLVLNEASVSLHRLWVRVCPCLFQLKVPLVCGGKL